MHRGTPAAGAVLGCFIIGGAALASPIGTLDRLVGDLEGRLDRALRGRHLARSDVAMVVRADPATSRELASTVRRLLAARLSAKGFRSQAVWASGPDRRRAEQRAKAGGFEFLLYATVSVIEGYLHLRADLIPTDALLWRDLRFPVRGALAHLHASVRVDAEVRAYQGKAWAPRSGFTEERIPLGSRSILAAGVADLDRDGDTEIVLLYPLAVGVFQLKGTRPRTLAPVTTFQMPPPLASQAPRRAVGSLLITDLDGDGRRELLARSSALEQAVVLSFDGKALVMKRTGAGFPLAAAAARGSARSPAEPISASLQPGRDYFVASSVSIASAAQDAVAVRLPARFYALRTAAITTRGGGRRGYAAAVDDAGRLKVFDAALRREIAAAANVGVAFDLVDIDDDGELDVVTTEASSDREQDGVSIFRLQGRKLRRRWRGGRIDGRIVALTHGVLEGSGRQAIIGVLSQGGGKTALVIVE